MVRRRAIWGIRGSPDLALGLPRILGSGARSVGDCPQLRSGPAPMSRASGSFIVDLRLTIRLVGGAR